MSGWRVVEADTGVHTVPTGERHALDGSCPCDPDVEHVAPDDGALYARPFYSHNSFDGREAVEWAESILSGAADA